MHGNRMPACKMVYVMVAVHCQTHRITSNRMPACLMASATPFRLTLGKGLNQITGRQTIHMVIKSIGQYVDFFLDLEMGKDVSLLSFANNEKIILKQKLEHKNAQKTQIKNGIVILEDIVSKISATGEKKVLETYGRQVADKDE